MYPSVRKGYLLSELNAAAQMHKPPLHVLGLGFGGVLGSDLPSLRRVVLLASVPKGDDGAVFGLFLWPKVDIQANTGDSRRALLTLVPT